MGRKVKKHFTKEDVQMAAARGEKSVTATRESANGSTGTTSPPHSSEWPNRNGGHTER